MRKCNAILSFMICILFLIHAVFGGFQLAGILQGGSSVLKVLAYIMLGMLLLHIIIGCKLTADTLRACKLSGVSYYRENRVFWLRRFSGFAVLLFVIYHLLIFHTDNSDILRLRPFEATQLVTQLLMTVSLGIHVVSNIRPLMLSFGSNRFLTDILVILSILLLLTGAAFVMYYLRWNRL